MGLRKKVSHSISLLSVFISTSRMLPSTCFTLNVGTHILPPSVGSPDTYLWGVQTDLSSSDTKKSSQCAFLAHSIMLLYVFFLALWIWWTGFCAPPCAFWQAPHSTTI